MFRCGGRRKPSKAQAGDAKPGLLQQIDAFIPIASKTIYFAVAGFRAKMLGKTYVDVLNFLQYEFTLPETEETWKRRQDLLGQLAAIFDNRRENVPLPKDFVERVKTVLPHIIGSATSERTTLSGQACRVIAIIAKHLEKEVQPQLDAVLPYLIAHCGSTKSVNQKNANDAIVAVCQHVGYNPRLFYHVCAAFREKRTPPRIYAPEWLRILLSTYRAQMDRDKDGEPARKAILDGLTDGQVKVRENSRAVYWEYATYDAHGAQMIMASLNAHAQAALRADSHNPDKTATKSIKVPRPDSALASIKAQNKKRAQQLRPYMPSSAPPVPASAKSTEFVMGNLDDMDAVPEGQKPVQDKQEKHVDEPSRGHQRNDSATGSRHLTSTHSRHHVAKTSKDLKLDVEKDATAAPPPVDARPLLSAPVRRARIVATPIASATTAGHRPGSREDNSRKVVEPPTKWSSEKPTSRPAPATRTEVTRHRKLRPDIVQGEEIIVSSSVSQQGANKNDHHHHIPVFAEDEEPSTADTPAENTTAAPAPVLEDKAMTAPAMSKYDWQKMSREQPVEEPVQPVSMPLGPVRPFAAEQQAPVPPELPTQMATGHEHIAEGKENTHAVLTRKKKSSSRSPNRSPMRFLRRNSIASAKKDLATAMEMLRHGTLDALGFRRLKKLLDSHPRELITRQSQFKELYELLIGSVVSIEEVTESRDKRAHNLNHAAYNRFSILNTLIYLLQQYPEWTEPVPGMTLSALLIARCTLSSGYASALRASDEIALYCCATSLDLLPTIDAVMDTLQQLEHIITTNDPIITPKSTTSIIYNSLQSLASESGSERPRFSSRLPVVMSFGLQILVQLLDQIQGRGQSLYGIQEDRLASFAEHLLATYTSVIKRNIIDFCTVLHAIIKPERKFYDYFTKESDKNLIHYYVAGASGTVYGNLDDAGNAIAQSSSLDHIDSEPSTFDPSSDASGNWQGLGTTHAPPIISQPSQLTLQLKGLDKKASVPASVDSFD